MAQTQIYATIPPTITTLLIDAPTWTDVILTKESSGVVVVGTKNELGPTGSGKGISLPVDQPVHLLLAPSTQLYILADNTSQKVGVVVQEAWILQIISLLSSIDQTLKLLAPGQSAVGGALGAYMGEEVPGYVRMPNPVPGGPLAVGNAPDLGDYYRAINGQKKPK